MESPEAMNPVATMALIEQWLGCDPEAGRRVWFEPEILPNASIFDVYKKKAMREGWHYRRWEWNFDPRDIEGMATAAILRVHDRLKEREQQERAGANRAPYKFSLVRDFLKFLNLSVIGSMRDEIDKEIRERKGLIDVTPGLGGDEKPQEFASPGQTQDPPAELLVSEKVSISPRLLENFQASLRGKRGLHLEGIIDAYKEGREISNEVVAYRIIEFLDDKGAHYPHITRFFEQKGIKQNTWDVIKRRLRHDWRKFREGHGKQDYEALKDSTS